MQDALREIESYKSSESVWLGSLQSKEVPAGQAEVQEKFERAAARVRLAVLKDAEAAESDPALASALATSIKSTIAAVLLPTFYSLSDCRRQLRVLFDRHGVLTEEELTHFYWLQFQLNHIETSETQDTPRSSASRPRLGRSAVSAAEIAREYSRSPRSSR